MPIIIYKRGAIFLVSLNPPNDPQDAIEKYVLCLQEGEIPTNSHYFTALVITSQVTGKHRPRMWDVLVEPKDSGLPKISKINCAQIHTIPERNIIRYSSMLSEEKIKEVDAKVLFYELSKKLQTHSAAPPSGSPEP